MFINPRHKKTVSQAHQAIAEMLSKNTEFDKHGFAYVVTTKANGEGNVIDTLFNRTKAQRKCFTKIKHKRKAYYTKFEKNHLIPAEILAEIAKEVSK